MITSNLALAIVATLIVLVGYACWAIFKATWAAFQSATLFDLTTEGVGARTQIFTDFARAVVLAGLAWGGTTWAARDGIVTLRSSTAALGFFVVTAAIACGYYGLLYLGLKKRRAQANRHR
ncbi:TPA: hypothetical protein ACT5CR_005455 [Burkholderia cenocepacia]|nr:MULTISPECIES: hypothetical protein [Burkholderia]MCA8081836.1 hypothetical protein [Burkholderia cepacia]MCQ4564158.1 hypothetical protein [Burkholderia contaminans]MCW3504565.1 hypothetical protein [Burkholderia cenocepacia]MCW3512027.1 hypothetical protein [Burkholderia cenocepacia]MCW3519640.1 hypothetical protein [Burkholderia cenocepacia]